MGSLTPGEPLEKMRSLGEFTIDLVGGKDAIEEAYGGIPESGNCDLVKIKDRRWRLVAPNGMIYEAKGI